jgi:hypothetical protein
VRGRFVQLKILESENEEALALFLCADGGRVTAWDRSDKSTKVDFGFKLKKSKRTQRLVQRSSHGVREKDVREREVPKFHVWALRKGLFI